MSEKFWKTIEAGKDAVLKCGDSVEILYLNEQANNGNGSFEMVYIDNTDIIKYVNKNGEPKNESEATDFIDYLLSCGRGYYCDNTEENKEEFDCLAYEEYPSAEFICGRDGSVEDEAKYIIEFAVRSCRWMEGEHYEF